MLLVQVLVENAGGFCFILPTSCSRAAHFALMHMHTPQRSSPQQVVEEHRPLQEGSICELANGCVIGTACIMAGEGRSKAHKFMLVGG